MSRAALFGGLAAGVVAVIVAVAASDGWLGPDVVPRQDDGAGPAPSTDTDAPRPVPPPAADAPATAIPGRTPRAPEQDGGAGLAPSTDMDAPRSVPPPAADAPATAVPGGTLPAPDGTRAPNSPEAAGAPPAADGVATDPSAPPAPLTAAPEAPAIADRDPAAPMPDAKVPDAPDLALALRSVDDAPAPGSAPAAPGRSAGDFSTPATGVAMPAFDLVRAESDGSALVAGSAEPGASVEILLDGDVAARTDVAGDGRFVVFLDMPDDGQVHVLALRQSARDSVIVSLDEIIVAPRATQAAAAPQAGEGDPQAGAQALSGTGDSDPAPDGPTELALAEWEPQPRNASPSDPASRESGTAVTRSPAVRAPGVPAFPTASAALPDRVGPVGAGQTASGRDGADTVSLPIASASAAANSLLRSGELAAAVVAVAPGPSVHTTAEPDQDAVRDPETTRASAQPLEGPVPLSPGQDPARENAGRTGSSGSIISGSGAETKTAGNAITGDGAADDSGDGGGDTRAQMSAPRQDAESATNRAPAPTTADTPAQGREGVSAAATTLAADSGPGAESVAPQAPSAPAETALPQPPSAAGGPVDMAAAPAPDPAGSARPMVLRSTPQGVEVMPDAPLDPGQVALDQITYDDTGAVSIAGRGERGGMVRLYIDNAPVATARIAADGRWRTALPEVDTGTYTLRVDRIDERGAVTARAESPFRRVDPDLLSAARADGAAVSVTVQPGNTLWGISRIRYGEGIDYVRIFDANREQIRDPDLIYPGQVFDLPE